MKELRVSKKEVRQQKTTPMTKMKMVTEAFSIFWVIALAGYQVLRALYRLKRLKKAYATSKKLKEQSKAK